MIVNLESNCAAGHILMVTTSPYAIVTIKKNDRTHTKTAGDTGVATFKGLSNGDWDVIVTAQSGSPTNTTSVNVQNDVSIEVVLNSVIDFTYTVSVIDGGYKVYDENDNDITSNPVTEGNWKIKFLTSGELTINALNGASEGIDVFCVGGGGNGGMSVSAEYSAGGAGGGGGGYTTTERNIAASIGKYDVLVGGAGGTSKFACADFTVEAKGGQNGGNGSYSAAGKGGDGGSGGAGGTIYSYSPFVNPQGGTDGENGSAASGGAGAGQISIGLGSTREFGEPDGTLYSNGGDGGGGGGSITGGGCGYNADPRTPTANTGNGGGGNRGRNYQTPAADPVAYGASGIVIIRNKRT